MEKDKALVLVLGKKKCRKCQQILPLTDFHKKPKNKDGYWSVCRACSSPYRKEYYRTHADTILETHRLYREKNRSILNKKQTQVMAKMRFQVLETIAKAHGSFMVYCLRCGFADARALQIDHISGGGTGEIRRVKTWTYYRYILHLPQEECRAKYQILCANCNMIKKEENRENYLWKEVRST